LVVLANIRTTFFALPFVVIYQEKSKFQDTSVHGGKKRCKCALAQEKLGMNRRKDGGKNYEMVLLGFPGGLNKGVRGERTIFLTVRMTEGRNRTDKVGGNTNSRKSNLNNR